MSAITAFENMKKHAAKIELPKFYKEDLDIDFNILKKYQNRKYVWMLREAGSLLLPLGIGANPFMFEFYIKNDSTCRFFMVNGFAETEFKELKVNEVEKLITQMPIEFGLIDCADDLINKVEKVLTDRNIASSGFSTVDYGTEPLHWRNWLNFFEGNNDLMEKVMRRAIKMLDDFSNRKPCRA